MFGDDELSQLDFNSFTHDYGVSEVQTGLTTGFHSQSIIYPLITHTQRLYYDSRNPEGHNAETLDGNLFEHNNSHSINVALRYNQLKPAIKVKDIISAIETKYGIDFVDSDFISTTPMDNLYMWLSKDKGILGGGSGQEGIKLLGSWQDVSGDDLTSISSDGTEVTFVYSGQLPISDLNFRLTIAPSSGYETIKYGIEYYRDNLLEASISGNQGTTNHNFGSSLPSDFDNKPVKFILKVETEGATLNFTPTLRVTVTETDDDPPFDETTLSEVLSCGGEISSVNEIIVSTQFPKMKVSDFISGLLKLFNLTIYYIDDESDANYGKIRLIPLDDFYDDNPSIFDITKYVDSSEHDVESTIPFSEVDFEYEKPKTLLMKQHEETFNHIFGDEEFKPEDVDRGKPYKVKVPFEHLKYERLFDEADNSLTNIQWGYSAGDNFKPVVNDEDAGDQPSGNYESVLTKPILFYGLLTGTGSTYEINYKTSSTTNTGLTAYWRASNTNERGYSVEDPRYTGVNSTSTAFRVASTALGAGAKVGDFMLNTTDDVLTTVTSIVDFNTVAIADDIFDLGDGFKTYRVPEYTLNFDNEIDEWTQTDYGGITNSLFKNFYKTYIEDAFNAKKRIFKLTAHLPNSVLLNYSLNDRFQIGDKVFTINSIDTNLKTGESKLELLNVL